MIQQLSSGQKASISEKYQYVSAWWIPAIPATNPAFLCPPLLESSSPQMPLEDMQIIYAIFLDSVISDGFGK